MRHVTHPEVAPRAAANPTVRARQSFRGAREALYGLRPRRNKLSEPCLAEHLSRIVDTYHLLRSIAAYQVSANTIVVEEARRIRGGDRRIARETFPVAVVAGSRCTATIVARIMESTTHGSVWSLPAFASKATRIDRAADGSKSSAATGTTRWLMKPNTLNGPATHASDIAILPSAAPIYRPTRTITHNA